MDIKLVPADSAGTVTAYYVGLYDFTHLKMFAFTQNEWREFQ